MLSEHYLQIERRETKLAAEKSKIRAELLGLPIETQPLSLSSQDSNSNSGCNLIFADNQPKVGPPSYSIKIKNVTQSKSLPVPPSSIESIKASQPSRSLPSPKPPKTRKSLSPVPPILVTPIKAPRFSITTPPTFVNVTVHSDNNNISPPCIPPKEPQQTLLKPCSDFACQQAYTAGLVLTSKRVRSTHYHCCNNNCDFHNYSFKKVETHIQNCIYKHKVDHGTNSEPQSKLRSLPVPPSTIEPIKASQPSGSKLSQKPRSLPSPNTPKSLPPIPPIKAPQFNITTTAPSHVNVTVHSDNNNISPPCIPQRTLKPCSDSICKQQYAAKFKLQKRGTHYHCLYCPYKYYNIKRVIKHIDDCRHVTQPAPVQPHNQGTNTKQLSPEPEVFDVTESEPEPVTLLMCNTTLGSNASPDNFKFNPCVGSSPNCMVTARTDRNCQTHYHCPNCWSYTCDRKPRLEQHYDKCLIKHPTEDIYNSAKAHANISVKPKLQSAIVDSKQGIYMVRSVEQGTGKPIHVKAQSETNTFLCTAHDCVSEREIFERSGKPNYMCKHLKACIDNNHVAIVDRDEFKSSMLNDNDLTSDKIALIKKLVNDAKQLQRPVIKSFIPSKKDGGTSVNVYYSVFYNGSTKKYYTKYDRVIVTYDRTTQKHKCDCSGSGCAHATIAMLVTKTDETIIRGNRIIENRKKNTSERLSSVKKTLDYILQEKQIPMIPKLAKNAFILKTEFISCEDTCFYCHSKLEVGKPHRGFVFALDQKRRSVKIQTKRCVMCDISYRYQEHNEGYFNYNDSSIFTMTFLEKILCAWRNNISTKTLLCMEAESNGMDYNIDLIQNAAKAYLSLKKIDFDISCIECGHYPVIITMDAIRSVCFDLKATDVIYDKQNEYTSFSAMYSDTRKHDLARGLISKDCSTTSADLRSLSVKMFSSLPPFITQVNSLAQPTKSCRKPPKTQAETNDFERADEIDIPLERIEQISKSKRGSAELKALCKELKLDTSGGKTQMIARLLASEPGHYSLMKKKFTKITGKSGGILRGVCSHGHVHWLKFLVLPEGVSDYVHIASSLKIPPAIFVTDIADRFAASCDVHYPGYFHPHKGMIANPEDHEIVEAYLTQGKKMVFDIKSTTARQDPSEYNIDTAHPRTFMFIRLSLFDRFHESNHTRGYGHALRLIDNIEQLEGLINTEAAEQANKLLAKKKYFLNEMDPNLFMKVTLYNEIMENHKRNLNYLNKMEVRVNEPLGLDNMGFLKTKSQLEADQHLPFDCPPTSGYKSSVFPTAVLHDSPDLRISWLNSILYLFHFSPLARTVDNTLDYHQETMSKLFSILADYDRDVHVNCAKYIIKECVRQTNEPKKYSIGKNICVISMFILFFKDILTKCNVQYVFGSLLGDSHLENIIDDLIKGASLIPDYIFLSNQQRTPVIISNNGSVTIIHPADCQSLLVYELIGYILKSDDGDYTNNMYSEGQYINISNISIKALNCQGFCNQAAGAYLLVFKLLAQMNSGSTSSTSSGVKRAPPAPVASDEPILKKSKVTKTIIFDNNSPFDFPPDLSKSNALVTESKVKNKIKIGRTVAFLPPWLPTSKFGRLALHKGHETILKSNNKLLDDVIIDSYVRMCVFVRKTDIMTQNVCLGIGPRHDNNELTSLFVTPPIDTKVIQILSVNRHHWLVVSNVMTCDSSPSVVQIFDSTYKETIQSYHNRLNPDITVQIVKLIPSCTEIQFIKTMQQNDTFSCGPLALAAFWALSNETYPHCYGQGFSNATIRKNIMFSFIRSAFIPPCSKQPRYSPKEIVARFKKNSDQVGEISFVPI